MCVQAYESLRAAVVTRAAMVNTHTHTRHSTRYTLSSAMRAKNPAIPPLVVVAAAAGDGSVRTRTRSKGQSGENIILVLFSSN